ncbi:MAG: 4-hydroxy-tetrahydrodipicolinate synthase [Gammaproteobacteria bacterium]
MVNPRGSIVAIVTPMSAGIGAEIPLDKAALERLVEFHVGEGTEGIVAVGTTGESATLTEHEHVETIRTIVEAAAGRVPVIAGTGANSTHEAIRLTREAQELGADACLLVTPYYNRPTQDGLYLHHKAVAEAVDIPQILYNVPSRTACDMLPETVARLAELPNIVGIKEATGDVSRVALIRHLAGDDFIQLSGDDATSLEFMLAGGDGVISVTANVAPRKMRALCDAARGGDADRARAIDAELQPLHHDLFVEANPIPVKWAVARMGLIAAGIRLPMTWLSEAYEARVGEAMRSAGVDCAP